MPSDTVENYLKALYLLGEQAGGAVALSELARELEVTPGTVTVMVQRMDEGDGLVDYRKREGATLTAAGRREALKVLRRHRLVELFLVEIVGLSWEQVHAEAETLEHAMSELVIERIAELLGHPEYDPHGTPIPDANGGMPATVRMPLCEAAAGNYMVVDFTDNGTEFREFCERRQLGHGARLEVVSRDSEADVVKVVSNDVEDKQQLALGGAVAAKILVRQLPSDADNAN